MTTNQPLSLFISSKMAELAEERRVVQAALKSYQMSGWLFERDAGARPESIQQTYLAEVASCDIYIGLFWLGYGEYTIEEYEKARSLKKPCLIYEKHVDIDKRDPQLSTFLISIQQVTDTEKGRTIYWFKTAEELAERVSHDVMHLLITDFRKTRRQPPIWNIPYRRNLFFTGREQLLITLHNNLTAKEAAALTQPQAISGMGGIGKTQTAIEYAYRYQDEYQAVLWINASTQDTLIASFLELASLLDLPEKNEQDQSVAIRAVKRWFVQHQDWLVIFDNADDLSLVEEYLPRSKHGHLILTTRNQAPGALATPLAVEQMNRKEGVQLLLSRARLLTEGMTLDQIPLEERRAAETIVQDMDGLPLALDQAGAYIEEIGCRVSAYLTSYRQRTMSLLQQRRGRGNNHPDPVAATWSLSFEQVEQQHPRAADLLRVCAFLAPDAIPETLFVGGAQEFGPQLTQLAEDETLLQEALGVLRRYSLVSRNREEQTISVHRLVQFVLKERMDQPTQRLWAERVVRALHEALPYPEHSTWPLWRSMLPHAQAAAQLIEQYTLSFGEAAGLLNMTGGYLKDIARYSEAEPLLERALAIREQELGPYHPSTAISLNNLAYLYSDQGKYSLAEPLYQRALAIREQELGPNHPHTALSLNNLAALYNNQGKYAQAEPLYQRALEIKERELGPNHPHTALSLNNLAALYKNQGKYAQAEPLLERALAIRKQKLGPNHPDTASSLNNLAGLYNNQGKYAQAEPLYQRALEIREQELGPYHPDTAISLDNLAGLYKNQGKYAQAEPLYQRALAIWERELGPTHPDTATSLNNLAGLYDNQGKYSQAEALYQRALAICEQELGPNHPNTASSLNNLALLYNNQGKYAQAEPLYQRALEISEYELGPYSLYCHQSEQSGIPLLRSGQVQPGRTLVPACFNHLGARARPQPSRYCPQPQPPGDPLLQSGQVCSGRTLVPACPRHCRKNTWFNSSYHQYYSGKLC